MNALRTWRFLIHGLVYSQGADRNPARQQEEVFARYLAREQRCIAAWRQGVEALPADGALAIVPIGHGGRGPAAEFEAWATGVLGPRCFVLNAPRPHERAFWLGQNAELAAGVFQDLQDALLGQGYAWNKEELDTGLQARACVGQLHAQLAERGFALDPEAVEAEAWGASFDGCVTKYSCNLRRILALRTAIEIVFEKTVPDARFLVEATCVGRYPFAEDRRLFVFRVGEQPVGVFVKTHEALSERAEVVRLPGDPAELTVMSKQGARLWPHPPEDKTPPRDVGFHEPPQELVRVVDGQLAVPVHPGMVWRLAKAPAYIFGRPGAAVEEFRDRLLAGRIE